MSINGSSNGPSDEPLIAGIDAGTSRIRALVFEPSGKLLAEGSAPTPTARPRSGWAEHDAEALWRATVLAVREAVEGVDDARRIAGLAVASMGEAGVLLGRGGQPLAPVIAWFDSRTGAEADWLAEHIGVEALFAVNGLRLDRFFSLCKWLWLREHFPQALERADKWLHVADYLAWRLGAEPVTDYSLASRTAVLDLESLSWSRSLMNTCGLDPRILQPLVASGTRIGTVSEEAARATGLPRGCAIGAGGHDHIVGAMAAGAWRSGNLLDSLGTAEALLLASEAPVFDRDFVERGYSQGAVVVAGGGQATAEAGTPATRSYYLVGAMTTSGACVEWFRHSLAGGAPHAELIAEAQAHAPGSGGAYFLPHMRMGAPPHAQSSAAGALFGLTPEHTRGALFRAVLEGLAYDARLVAEGMLEVSNSPAHGPVLAIGGNTRNELLMRIKASVFGRVVTIVDIPEATSLGAALLGGLAAGVFDNVSQALDSLHVRRREIAPDPQHARFYAVSFDQVYRQTPTALADLHERARKRGHS
ncbi:MAG: FGGY-family carbohydrate kinase [Gammaproteobacteria bacterium]